MARGTGISTAQVLNAPEGGVYIIPGSRGYFLELLRRLGRNDLRIESMDWIVWGRWRGVDPRLVVIDHACSPETKTRSDFLAFLDFLDYRRARLLSLDINLEEPLK